MQQPEFIQELADMIISALFYAPFIGKAMLQFSCGESGANHRKHWAHGSGWDARPLQGTRSYKESHIMGSFKTQVHLIQGFWTAGGNQCSFG